MNWQYVIFALFGVVIFTLVVATILFYVHHHVAKRQKALQGGLRHPTEGRYFNRFVPYQLKDKYGALVKEYEGRGQLDRRIVTYATYSSIIGVALLILTIFAYTQRERFLKAIDLTDDEVAKLSEQHHNFVEDTDQYLPEMTALIGDLKGLSFAFVSSPSDSNWQVGSPARQLTQEYYLAWKDYLESLGLHTRRCLFSEVNSCVAGRPTVLLVLPGSWDLKTMDNLAQRGFRMILLGPPAQIFGDARESFSWRGLRFELFQHNDVQQVVMRGDHFFTLGFDAGLQIKAPPVYAGYRVLTNDPAAYSARLDNFLGGTLEARIAAQVDGAARIVWLDYAPSVIDLNKGVAPRQLEALNASVFRFILRKSYSHLAQWPEGKSFAALVTQDLVQPMNENRSLQKLFAEKAFPISVNILSDSAQLSRSRIQKLSTRAELNCAGDGPQPFPKSGLKEQVLRVARCQKVLWDLTGQMGKGLRPPDDLYTGETLDALLNNSLQYILVNRDTGRFTPIHMSSRQTGGELIMLAIPTSGESQIWLNRGISSQSAQLIFQGELDWLMATHGLYGFFFSDRQESSASQVAALREMITTIQSKDGFFSTAGEISQWWSIRHRLLAGETVPDSLLQKFRPVRLTFGSDGQLRHEPVSR